MFFQIMDSIFFQDFLFLLFELFSKFLDILIVFFNSCLSLFCCYIMSSLIETSFFVIFRFFRLAQIFPVRGNHFIDLFDLYIWVLFCKFFESLFKISWIAINDFLLFGQELIFFLKLLPLSHSDIVYFVIVLFLLLIKLLPFLSYNLWKLCNFIVSLWSLLAVTIKKESHVWWEWSRWSRNSWYTKRIFKIFLVLLKTELFFSGGHNKKYLGSLE